MKNTPWFIIIVLTIFLSTPVLSQDTTSVVNSTADSLTTSWVPVKSYKYAAGGRFIYPVLGVSAQYFVNEKFTAEAVLGAYFDIFIFGARGLYDVPIYKTLDTYAYGSLGVVNYNTFGGFYMGAGVGIKYDDLGKLLNLPVLDALTVSAELGGTLVLIKDRTTSRGLSFGAGIHYRF